jgi:hypothetical protein
MKVLVSEIKYEQDSPLDLPTSFHFEINDEIASDDTLLSKQVYELVKHKTNHKLIDCLVDVD